MIGENLALDFLANQLYQEEAKSKTGISGVRWWCLREPIKHEYRDKVQLILVAWSQNEKNSAAAVHSLNSGHVINP